MTKSNVKDPGMERSFELMAAIAVAAHHVKASPQELVNAFCLLLPVMTQAMIERNTAADLSELMLGMGVEKPRGER